jgi:hypothetical protein
MLFNNLAKPYNPRPPVGEQAVPESDDTRQADAGIPQLIDGTGALYTSLVHRGLAVSKKAVNCGGMR